MDQMKGDLEAVLDQRWAKLRLARTALAYSGRNSRITMQIFLLRDKRLIARLRNDRAENTRMISKMVVELESQIGLEKEKQLLVAVKDARTPYVASYLRALQLLLDENKPEAARTLMVEETTPALFNYHNAWDQFLQFQMEEMDNQVQVMAYYDALTGLPNRALLQDRISVALASARRRREKVALLFLDLDQFKTINDSLEHSAGDLLLKGFAKRLKQGTREQDAVARLAGDEFVVLLSTVKETGDAAVAAQRIVDSMAAGFVVQDRLLNVTCSIGISIFPDDCTTGEALMKNADIAMYCAKQSGRNMFQFFTKEMSVQALERLRLESSLRGALQRKEFFLVYQPQVDITTGRITSVEALLRWHHPELGLIPPDKFIPFAENSGLIISIGEWVLKTACAQARQWQSDGLPVVPVAVNVSSVQFAQRNFVDLVRTALCETGLDPQYLELELTESLLISNADVMLAVLKDLKEMGVKLAIDDFGTGYSSLSYLRHFPVYKLKIDRSFVRDLTVNADDAAITDTIISMAKSLGLTVVAEGVENEDQFSFLQQHRCDEMQGFYFSKPLAAEDFAEKIRAMQSDLRGAANKL